MFGQRLSNRVRAIGSHCARCPQSSTPTSPNNAEATTSPMPSLDLPFVRAQFPAFSEPSLQDWAFFENAGGSYACGHVIERLTRFYRETKVQPYGPYPPSSRDGGEMDKAPELGSPSCRATGVHYV